MAQPTDTIRGERPIVLPDSTDSRSGDPAGSHLPRPRTWLWIAVFVVGVLLSVVVGLAVVGPAGGTRATTTKDAIAQVRTEQALIRAHAAAQSGQETTGRPTTREQADRARAEKAQMRAGTHGQPAATRQSAVWAKRDQLR